MAYKIDEDVLEDHGILMIDGVSIPPQEEDEMLRSLVVPYAFYNKRICNCGRPDCKGAVVSIGTLMMS